MTANYRLIKKRPSGMTLVELLVALTLGLLVIAGIGQIYTAAKRSYEIQSSMSRLQDVGRYAIETITRDIQRAGYWGLSDMKTIINNNPGWFPNGGIPYDPATYATCSTTDSSWGSMVQWRIFGLNDLIGPNGSSYACISSSWGQGDVLVVRYADPAPPPACDPLDNHLYIRTWPYDASLSTVNPLCAAPSMPNTTVHRVVANAYYVRKNSPAQCNGTPIPSLAREELTDNGVPKNSDLDLVAGVEDLQFQFGVDSDNDGSVNQYFNGHQINGAPATPNWNQVVSVRVWVLVRSECPETGYNPGGKTITLGDIAYNVSDHYRRQLYSTTVALRSY